MNRRLASDMRASLSGVIRGLGTGGLVVRRETVTADRYADALLQALREGAADGLGEQLVDEASGLFAFMYDLSGYDGDEGYGA